MASGSKRVRVILSSLERQGCVVEAKKSGWFVKLPGGGAITMHGTTSDHRAELNIRSLVLRAGLKWPFDGDNRS